MDQTTRLTLWVRRVLIAGILLSSFIILIGGVHYLFNHGFELVGTDYSIFHGEPKDLRGISNIIDESVQLHSQGIIQFGVLLLILTPIVRVVISILAFIKGKDWIYVLVTTYVLAVLLYSLIWRG